MVVITRIMNKENCSRLQFGYLRSLRVGCLAMLLVVSIVYARAQKTYHGDGPDDWLRFVPVASAYALKTCGVESASSWKRLAVNTAASYVLACGTTWILKQTIRERRPDGTDDRAFPSGHATVAFVGAAILDKEFRHVSPWISVGGYVLATGVAIDRIARNRHEWQDVAAGAAIGLGGTWLGYWLGDKVTGENSRYRVAFDGNSVSLAIRIE